MPTIDDLKQTLTGEEILFLLNNSSDVKPVFADGSNTMPSAPPLPTPATGGLSSIISGASKDANADLQNIMQGTSDFIKRLSSGDYSQSTFDMFSNVGKSITDQYKAGVSDIKDAAKGVSDAATNNLKDTKAQITGIGDGIVNGVVDGVSNKAIQLYQFIISNLPYVLVFVFGAGIVWFSLQSAVRGK